MKLQDFTTAREHLQKVLLPTHLIYSPIFSEESGNQIYIKPENLQKTGAFKIRGAYNKINKLTEETMKELTGKEEEKVGYIRLERIKFKSTSEEDYTIKGTVIDTEFKGVLVQYTVKAESGQILRVIQKNDYLEIFELGQELTLFIHPNDILQY